MTTDLRLAFRQLRKARGFSFIAAVPLALGNTAIFSVINALLLQALPYPTPDRIRSHI
jgi:putative ABC transport system permease protein